MQSCRIEQLEQRAAVRAAGVRRLPRAGGEPVVRSAVPVARGRERLAAEEVGMICAR